MNKVLKANLIFLGIIILIVIMFFSIDFWRVQNQEKPIFSIYSKTHEDSDVKEYIGIGYKVLEFPEFNGVKEKIMGSLFMDVNTKIQEFENKKIELTEQKMKNQIEIIINNMKNNIV